MSLPLCTDWTLPSARIYKIWIPLNIQIEKFTSSIAGYFIKGVCLKKKREDKDQESIKSNTRSGSGHHQGREQNSKKYNTHISYSY